MNVSALALLSPWSARPRRPRPGGHRQRPDQSDIPAEADAERDPADHARGGAVGVSVSHSGSAVALLFDPRQDGSAMCTYRARRGRMLSVEMPSALRLPRPVARITQALHPGYGAQARSLAAIASRQPVLIIRDSSRYAGACSAPCASPISRCSNSSARNRSMVLRSSASSSPSAADCFA